MSIYMSTWAKPYSTSPSLVESLRKALPEEWRLLLLLLTAKGDYVRNGMFKKQA